jgi:hypothetical protein
LTFESAQELSRLVTSTGYRSFHLAFGDGNHCFKGWQGFVGKLEDPLRGLVQLLLLCRYLNPGRARCILGSSLFQEMSEEGLLVEEAMGVRTPGLILISFRSLLFFHQCGPRPSIYFGNDSIALGMYQNPSFRGTTLDLCSGTSIQAMISAQHGSRCYAVEIDPRAAKVAATNLRLNDLHEKVQLINRSLEDYAADAQESFDLITFNPPLLPIPAVLHYPFVGDGGGDGLEVTRRVLNLYLPRLTAGGGIEFIGCGLGREHTPIFVDDLAAILRQHDAQGRVQLLSRYDLRRGDSFYDSLVRTAAMSSEVTLDLAYAVFDLHFQRLGFNELYPFFLRGERQKPSANNGSTIAITDVSEGGNCWFQNRS